jgi:hypothetical protein
MLIEWQDVFFNVSVSILNSTKWITMINTFEIIQWKRNVVFAAYEFCMMNSLYAKMRDKKANLKRQMCN